MGTRIDVTHVAATPPGLTVTVRATLTAVDGRRLSSTSRAHDGIELIHERAP